MKFSSDIMNVMYHVTFAIYLWTKWYNKSKHNENKKEGVYKK